MLLSLLSTPPNCPDLPKLLYNFKNSYTSKTNKTLKKHTANNNLNLLPILFSSPTLFCEEPITIIAVNSMTTSINKMRQQIIYFGKLCLHRYTKYIQPMLSISADSFISCAEIPNKMLETTRQKNLQVSREKKMEQSNLILRNQETSESELHTKQKTVNKYPQFCQINISTIIEYKQHKLSVRISPQQTGILQAETILFLIYYLLMLASVFLRISFRSKGGKIMRWEQIWTILQISAEQQHESYLLMVGVKQKRAIKLMSKSSMSINIIGLGCPIFSYIQKQQYPYYKLGNLLQIYMFSLLGCGGLRMICGGDKVGVSQNISR